MTNPGDHRYQEGSREHFADLGTGRHESVANVLPFFAWSHLPERLQHISQRFADLAITMLTLANNDLELAECLRKLLEAKDCAVRAAL